MAGGGFLSYWNQQGLGLWEDEILPLILQGVQRILQFC